MPARQNVFMMSPELIHKFETAPNLTGPVNSTSSLVAVLEKALDNNKEILLADEKRLDKPAETVIQLEMPSPELAEQIEEILNEEENEKPAATGNVNDSEDENDEKSVQLFEVSVDICEKPTDEPESSDEENSRSSTSAVPTDRRNSRWSATVLFLASEVQLMVNLAHLSPPDGYQIAPKKVRMSSTHVIMKRDIILDFKSLLSVRFNQILMNASVC